MTIHLPEELEHYVRNEVRLGRFVSEDEALTEAVRLLRQRTKDDTSEPMPISEEQFAQKMMQSGLLRSVPPRPTLTPRDFQPVHIKGEPLSETVIRERR